MNPALNSAAATMNTGMAPVATPWFFYALAGAALISALFVITRRNAVHSALALIVTLLSVAGLYLMLYARSWLACRSSFTRAESWCCSCS